MAANDKRDEAQRQISQQLTQGGMSSPPLSDFPLKGQAQNPHWSSVISKVTVDKLDPYLKRGIAASEFEQARPKDRNKFSLSFSR